MTISTQATQPLARQSGDIKALLAADDLAGAAALAAEAVRRKPQDLALRLLLIDLLILGEDFERADRQAGMAVAMAPQEAVGLSLLRGEIAGMHARANWYADAAVPSFPEGPTAADEAALRLALAIRTGEAAAIAEAAGVAASFAPARMARDDGEPAEIRDLDDRLPHALEVVTSGGAYLWIGFAAIARIAFEPPRHPRDLAWRRATLRLRSGSTAQVLVPAIYHGEQAGSDAVRLGRETGWIEGAGGVVTGYGQRCLLIGEEMVPISDIASLSAGEGGDG